jgi:hypothetical protein
MLLFLVLVLHNVSHKMLSKMEFLQAYLDKATDIV